MTQKTFRSHKYDYAKLRTLTKLCAQHLEQLYDHFGIRASYRNDILVKSVCPIHGGDNDTALNMYHNGDYKVHYKCRTHQCEDIFGNGFIDFIKGCLSRFKYGWTKEGDKQATFHESVDFLLKFLDQDFDSLEAENVNIEKMKFGGMVSAIGDDKKGSSGATREFYLSKIETPSSYYVGRGFSKEVLEEYDVGYCDNPEKPMYERAVVPIYDNDYQYIVGYTGRSVFEKCEKCGNYHNPIRKCHHFPKWYHNKGFQKQKWLYNYWKAKDEILKTGVVILVESPGNVWRLWEAGIYNMVCIFGTSLNGDQKKILDESGALSLVCLMDNDEAGKTAAKKIEEQCSRLYRLFFPTFAGDDIAELNTDEITDDIQPWIEKAKELYKGI